MKLEVDVAMTMSEKAPLSERINVRLLVMFGLVGLMMGWVLYTVIKSNLTGGVERLPDGTVSVDLKAMSNFEMDQINATVKDVPAKFRELDGKKVVMEGEMYRPYSAGANADEFQLVYSIAKCCFNGPKKVQHFVDAKLTPNAKVRLSSDSVLVRVVGTLHVNVVREAGRVMSVFQLEVERIEAV